MLKRCVCLQYGLNTGFGKNKSEFTQAERMYSTAEYTENQLTLNLLTTHYVALFNRLLRSKLRLDY